MFRGLNASAYAAQQENNGTPEYYKALRLRQIWCEGNFSHQKANHNLDRTGKRGLGKAFEHCLLSATAFNLRRMVKLLQGLPPQIKYSLLALGRRLFFRRLLLFFSLCQQHQSDHLPALTDNDRKWRYHSQINSYQYPKGSCTAITIRNKRNKETFYISAHWAISRPPLGTVRGGFLSEIERRIA
jgi:hypothetical protein